MTPFPAAALLGQIRAAGGATFNSGGQPVRSGDLWLYPAFPGRTLILGPDTLWEPALLGFVGRHRSLVETGGQTWRAFGAWIRPDGRLYLDIVEGRATSDAAFRAATAAGQREGRPVVAIYQASTGTTLSCPPPG